MTALDDRIHATASMKTIEVMVNVVLAISAPDLYKKFCQMIEKAGLNAVTFLV